MRNIVVYFNDSPQSSKHNKKTTDFLDKNMELLIRKGNIRFTFNIIQQQDLDNLKKNGVKELPAICIDKKYISSSGDIINTLSNLVQSSKIVLPKKTLAEDVGEFLNNAIGLSADGKTDFSKLDQENEKGGNVSDPTKNLNSFLDARNKEQQKFQGNNFAMKQNTAQQMQPMQQPSMQQQTTQRVNNMPAPLTLGDGGDDDNDVLANAFYEKLNDGNTDFQ